MRNIIIIHVLAVFLYLGTQLYISYNRPISTPYFFEGMTIWKMSK